MTRLLACIPSVILYTSLSVLPDAASAQESAKPLTRDQRQLDLVYSYGLKERAADDVGSAVTIITATDIIAQQYNFVADALKSAPGVAVARNGAFGDLQARVFGAGPAVRHWW